MIKFNFLKFLNFVATDGHRIIMKPQTAKSDIGCELIIIAVRHHHRMWVFVWPLQMKPAWVAFHAASCKFSSHFSLSSSTTRQGVAVFRAVGLKSWDYHSPQAQWRPKTKEFETQSLLMQSWIRHLFVALENVRGWRCLRLAKSCGTGSCAPAEVQMASGFVK